MRKTFAIGAMVALVLTLATLAACGKKEEAAPSAEAKGPYYAPGTPVRDIVIDAASKGKVGNWGLGNEYEVKALLTKYGQPTTYLSQAFDMEGFNDDSILLASAMTYNELGLVKNGYTGGYGYGDKVAYIDMNNEGVAMLQDNIFTTAKFAKSNPETVKAFVRASLKGWEYACANPEEAAKIVFRYGSSVFPRASDLHGGRGEEARRD